MKEYDRKCHAAQLKDIANAYKVSVPEPESRRKLGKPKRTKDKRPIFIFECWILLHLSLLTC
jgi:hypothetical protein